MDAPCPTPLDLSHTDWLRSWEEIALESWRSLDSFSKIGLGVWTIKLWRFISRTNLMLGLLSNDPKCETCTWII